jgi:hypothetical protein
VNAQPQAARYSVRLSIDYPDRDLNRLTTFFRIIVAIPIIIVLAAVSGGTWDATWDRGRDYAEFQRWQAGAFCSSPRC